MEITAILVFLFLLPGYFTYKIISLFADQYGKDFDSFDKTIVSLAFDLFIFTIVLLIISPNNWYDNLFEARTFEAFMAEYKQFLALLGLVVTFMIATALLYVFILFLIKCFSGIDYFNSFWNKAFVKPKDAQAIKIYKLGYDPNKSIAEGFASNVSLTNDGAELEITLKDKKKMDEGFAFDVLQDTPTMTYINPTQDIKIEVYDPKPIEDKKENPICLLFKNIISIFTNLFSLLKLVRNK